VRTELIPTIERHDPGKYECKSRSTDLSQLNFYLSKKRSETDALKKEKVTPCGGYGGVKRDEGMRIGFASPIS